MPAICETDEVIDQVAMPAHVQEKPQAQGKPRGAWKSLIHGMLSYLRHTPQEQQMTQCYVPQPFESPMDRIAREYPALSCSTLAIV